MKQSGQTVQQFAAPFTGEVDQNVLTKDEIKLAQRRTRGVQQVHAGKTNAFAEFFSNAELLATG